MSTMALRTAMIPVTRRIRAYFAPVDRATGTPAIFDPGKHGAFALDAPPAPWLDLGWIDNCQGYRRSSTQPLKVVDPPQVKPRCWRRIESEGSMFTRLEDARRPGRRI